MAKSPQKTTTPETLSYRIRADFRSVLYHGGARHSAGDILTLSAEEAAQYSAFVEQIAESNPQPITTLISQEQA